MLKAMKQFPDDFLWGASTASYQVEGGAHTQWSVWEQTNAEHLAATEPKRLSWLPRQEEIQPQMSDPANYICGKGIEHYERYETDFDILQQLHCNAFRFGIEWARVEPEEGRWDELVIGHYRGYIAALKRRGIVPVLTLWHWTMPVWFTNKGAFEKRDNLKYFERYAQRIADEFGQDMRYVITLNEPNVYASFSYVIGEWPPQHKNVLQGLKVYKNLVVAHQRAYAIFKAVNPDVQISVAAQLGDTRAKSPRNPANRLVVNIAAYAWNWWFLDKCRDTMDFIGINYYFTEYRDWLGRIKNPKQPVSDLGWYMEPSGVGQLLTTVWKRYQKPLLIVENGLADEHDQQRQWWLSETLKALEQVLAKDVNVIGYLHWSLLDNFEWRYGWWPKFGLVSVDHTTMQRTIRPSAYWFADQIQKTRSDL